MVTKLENQDGQVSVHVLRRALAGLAASVGGDLRKPQEISRRFGVDKTLAWRISRAVREENAWQALTHLPSRSGISIFAGAMSQAGAPAEKLEALRSAQEAFERFVQEHAGDRETLDMIVSVPTRKSSHKKLETFRKGGFQCNASLLGVRAKAHLVTRLVVPSKSPGMLDLGIISALIGLCRLRPSTPWPIASIKNWGGLPGDVLDASRGVLPMDLGSESAHGTPTPIMRQFCSPRDITLRTTQDACGAFRYVLDGGSVGNAGSVDTMCGWVSIANAPMHPETPGERGEHGVSVNTPAEELIVDMLIHRSLPIARDIRAEVYSAFPGSIAHPSPGSENSILPVPTEVMDLGLNNADAPTPLLGNYEEVLNLSATRMGTRLADLHLFRYRLPYPPVPSMVVVSHPLVG
jgi:hypothetical protein